MREKVGKRRTRRTRLRRGYYVEEKCPEELCSWAIKRFISQSYHRLRTSTYATSARSEGVEKAGCLWTVCTELRDSQRFSSCQGISRLVFSLDDFVFQVVQAKPLWLHLVMVADGGPDNVLAQNRVKTVHGPEITLPCDHHLSSVVKLHPSGIRCILVDAGSRKWVGMVPGDDEFPDPRYLGASRESKGIPQGRLIGGAEPIRHDIEPFGAFSQKSRHS